MQTLYFSGIKNQTILMAFDKIDTYQIYSFYKYPSSTCNSNNLITKIPGNCGFFLINGRQTAKIYFKAASIY